TQPEPDPGAAETPALPVAPPASPRTLPLAIVSLVLGIVSYPIWFAGFVTAPLAAVSGILARRRIAAQPLELTGGGLALGGMIAGLVWMSIASMVVLLMTMLSA
ncbi:MAG TPA: DUF4190 domain-containing protein, partial [Egibacteraceae bacterium]|nr:DUF4190 domain-containing protein [Egibacteraceae bacterium]